MQEIKNKIKELIKLSETETDWEKVTEKMNKQDSLMEELTNLARKNNTMLGRNIQYPVADGMAIYLITKVNEKSVKLTWINYCDGYCDRQFGERGGTLNMQEALSSLQFEDMMDGMRK